MTVSQPPAAEPDGVELPGDRYPQLLRSPRHRWWKPALGLLLATVVLAGTSVGVVLFVTALGAVLGGGEDPFSEEALDADKPLGLLANNLVIAAIIPAVTVAVLVVHREHPGWLCSVVRRLRWRALMAFLATALVVVAVFFALTFLVPPVGFGDVDVPDAGTLTGLLAVILLTTPLQAAGEELGFRGYLSQAVAAWFRRPVAGTVVAAVVSAVAFAFAHGTQDAWLFGDRLLFGLLASWLAWRTGGLEAPIALHVANNLVSLVWTAATGSIESSLTTSTLDWELFVVDAGMMAVFAVVADRLVRRWQLDVRRVRPPDRPGLGEGRQPRMADRDGGPATLSGPSQVGYPVRRPKTPPPAGDGSPWGMG